MEKEDKMEELKPCPFCGGKAKVRYENNATASAVPTVEVMCLRCGALGMRFKSDSPTKAITQWNTRTSSPESREKCNGCGATVVVDEPTTDTEGGEEITMSLKDFRHLQKIEIENDRLKDELADTEGASQEENCSRCDWTAERDLLRTEAEKHLAHLTDIVVDLQAKLAEAEKERDEYKEGERQHIAICGKERKRAGRAEKRVEELEGQLAETHRANYALEKKIEKIDGGGHR